MIEYKTPLKVTCLSHKYGGFKLECKADTEDAINNEYRDKEVYVNPMFITDITFNSIEVEKISPIYCEKSKRTEEYFIIKLLNGECYKVRKKYWEQFYEDWTGIVREESL